MQPALQHFPRVFRARRLAFSLLEMSIVIIILGIMIAALMPVVTQTALKNKYDDLERKMDAIEAALQVYRNVNNRLPCPAQRLAATHASFGAETATPGTCTSSVTLDADTDEAVVAGMVPVRALGLADEYAYDPWGRAFSYAVDRRITNIDSFTTYDMDDTDIGNISIREMSNGAAGAVITSKAVVAITSFGPNGHGGYLTSGSAYSSGSTNAQEQANCYCNASAANVTPASVIFYTGIGSSSNAGTTNTFDDTLRYFVRSSFTSMSEINNSDD